MPDPLAGFREAINRGDSPSLLWPDDGQGCPVEVGQVFALRSCRIEITRVHRVQQKGRLWLWRAEYRRYVPDRIYLLRRGRGGYTEKESEAMAAQDSPEPGTLAFTDAGRKNPLNPKAPPEPEAVPPHEIGSYTGDVLARARYERELAESRADLESLPIEGRLARLRQLAGEKHVDISSEVRVIERRLQAIEHKVLDHVA